MKVFRLILILMIGILTACGTTDTQLPTQVILPTDIPIEIATSTLTATPSATPSPTPTAQPASLPSSTNEIASVAFLQTIPNWLDVDIYIEASAYAFAMRYGENTQPSDLSAGTYTIRIMSAGASPRDNVTPLLTQQVTIEPQATTVMVIYGTAESPQLTAYMLSTVPLDGGQSRVSLINLVNNVPNLTIRQSGIDMVLPVIYGQQTIPANIRAGDTTLTIQTGETVLSTDVLTFRERENVALIAYGDPATEVNFTRFNNQVLGRTTVRLVNISPVATLVDVYLNDTLFFANADYGRPSERQQITAGDYAVAVYTGGADISRSAPLYTTTLTPRQDETLTLVFMGGDETLNLGVVRDDLSPLPPNQSRWIFVHALPNEGVIQPSFALEPIPFAGRIAYGQATTGVLLNAEMQTLYFNVNEGADKLTVELAPNLLFEQGVGYIYFITGRDESTAPLIISERLTIDERLAIDYEAEPTQAPLLPVRVQVINMLTDRLPVDILIDGAPVASALPHAQLSAPVIASVMSNTSLIGIRQPSGETDLSSQIYSFQRDLVHTIYVYGDNATVAQVAIRRESTFPETNTNAFVRMTNLTVNPDVRFNLSIGDASVEAIIPLDFTPLPVVQFREEMIASAQPLIFDIQGGELSPETFAPARLNDLYVIDIVRGLVAFKQLDVNFEAGVLYDIIVIQNANDIQVNLWIIPIRPQTG